MKYNFLKIITLTAILIVGMETVTAASIIVAAHDSSAEAKARADYVCNSDPNDEINLLLSITRAQTYSVEVDVNPAQTRTVQCLGRHSVHWLGGTYNLGSTLTIPDSADCIIKAEGTCINGPTDGSDAIVIRGMNRCRYYFGMVKLNSSTGSALKIQPTSSMPALMSKVTYSNLFNTDYEGTGLYIDPSNENVCNNLFRGTDISGFDTGILVDNAAIACNTNWFWVSYIRMVNTCIYEKGVNVERNFWEVNVDASIANSEAIRTAASHGKWYVIMGTYGYMDINNALVLESGASHNVVEMHPPIDYFAWENNSGNDTNVFLSTTRPPYN